MLQKGNTSQEISARDLLTSLRTMSLVLGLPLDMHLCGSSSNGPRLPTFLKLLQNPHILLTCGKAPPKWSETVSFSHFWLPNVLRARTACTCFIISASISAPRTVCFAHFDLKICFTPHFFHISTSESAPNMVFCAFWLRNAFRATTACNFSSPIPPNGSALAALASLLFDPPEPQTIGKHTVVHDFSTLTLSLLWSSFFFSSLLWLFPPVLFIFPYCRKFDF